jgi:hypothetical protein
MLLHWIAVKGQERLDESNASKDGIHDRGPGSKDP